MNIRSATETDIPSLMRLYHFLEETYQDDESAIKIALHHPASEILVLIENEKIVATATISHRAVPCVGLVGYIDDVVTDPLFRGRGFGRAISQACIDRGRELKCIRIELTSRPSRIAANALYESMGFAKRNTNAFSLQL